jgi:hypothetical protein
MQMKLVQLGPQSIENLMTRPESLPLSLNDLLAAIPPGWREQSLGCLQSPRNEYANSSICQFLKQPAGA